MRQIAILLGKISNVSDVKNSSYLRLGLAVNEKTNEGDVTFYDILINGGANAKFNVGQEITVIGKLRPQLVKHNGTLKIRTSVLANLSDINAPQVCSISGIIMSVKFKADPATKRYLSCKMEVSCIDKKRTGEKVETIYDVWLIGERANDASLQKYYTVGTKIMATGKLSHLAENPAILCDEKPELMSTRFDQGRNQ